MVTRLSDNIILFYHHYYFYRFFDDQTEFTTRFLYLILWYFKKPSQIWSPKDIQTLKSNTFHSLIHFKCFLCKTEIGIQLHFVLLVLQSQCFKNKVAVSENVLTSVTFHSVSGLSCSCPFSGQPFFLTFLPSLCFLWIIYKVSKVTLLFET